jgi:hypothetical protein
MRTSAHGVRALRATLLEQGGELAALSTEAPESEGAGPAQLAASGPRAVRNPDEYELLLEMILEGSHLHYGPQRVVRTHDPDLALLLGDQLYALGLARLAGLGDLDAVVELADVISLVAQAQAAGNPGLASAAWEAGAAAVGWGPGAGHHGAKALARAGHPDAFEALHAAAAESAAWKTPEKSGRPDAAADTSLDRPPHPRT